MQTIFFLKFVISSIYSFSVFVLASLCQTWKKTPKDWFSPAVAHFLPTSLSMAPLFTKTTVLFVYLPLCQWHHCLPRPQSSLGTYLSVNGTTFFQDYSLVCVPTSLSMAPLFTKTTVQFRHLPLCQWHHCLPRPQSSLGTYLSVNGTTVYRPKSCSSTYLSVNGTTVYHDHSPVWVLTSLSMAPLFTKTTVLFVYLPLCQWHHCLPRPQSCSSTYLSVNGTTVYQDHSPVQVHVPTSLSMAPLPRPQSNSGTYLSVNGTTVYQDHSPVRVPTSLSMAPLFTKTTVLFGYLPLCQWHHCLARPQSCSGTYLSVNGTTVYQDHSPVRVPTSLSMAPLFTKTTVLFGYLPLCQWHHCLPRPQSSLGTYLSVNGTTVYQDHSPVRVPTSLSMAPLFTKTTSPVQVHVPTSLSMTPLPRPQSNSGTYLSINGTTVYQDHSPVRVPTSLSMAPLFTKTTVQFRYLTLCQWHHCL